MLREIRVYGQLAKLLGRRRFKAEVASAGEAVRFLLANFPFLEKHMSEPDRYYRVTVAERDLDKSELSEPVGTSEVIKIAPVVAGAGAVGRIILGVALIAFAVLVPGLGAATAVSVFGTTFGAVSLGIGLVGAALALGGVAQLLTPTPRLRENDRDPRRSFSFSGVQNTSRQGSPVPIIYGEVISGAVVISAGLDTVQVAA